MFERKFLNLPWQAVRPSVDVKLLAHDKELYILARSHPRILKERAMRRRRLKILWRRLHEMQQQTLTRDALLLELGAAKKEAGRAHHLVEVQLPDPNQPVTPETFTFSLRRDKLRTVAIPIRLCAAPKRSPMYPGNPPAVPRHPRRVTIGTALP